MNRKLVILSVLILAILLGAGAVFAASDETTEEGTGGDDGSRGMFYIAAAFGMALVSSVCAIAMGITVKSFSEGVSRNPSAAGKLQLGLLITLVLIETLALYVFAVIFMKVV